MQIIKKIKSIFSINIPIHIVVNSSNIPIHIIVINGCMADETEFIEEGIILCTIKKKVYGSTKDVEFYKCKFPSGTKELAISRCYIRKETGIISYWT